MKTVAVIFGGKTTEHDVSVITALASVIKPLETTGSYKVEPVYISKDGSWFWDDRLKDIKLYQSDKLNQLTAKLPKVRLLFDNGLTLVKPGRLGGKETKLKVDVIFPAMHGTHGEDGELMGLLQMADVPFVGCDMRSSAVAMDKVLSKQVVATSGVETGNYEYFYSTAFAKKPAEIIKQIEKSLKYPLFIKPVHLGSSIGITRVSNQNELQNALEVACHYDDKVIVEEEVKNLAEVTLPIIGNDEPLPALLEQPLTKPGEFFDFDTKYLQGGKKSGGKGEQGAQGYSKLPADLPKDLHDLAVETGLQVYKAVGCSGIARVDMLVDTKAKTVYFNEINPLPGSLYAHNWRQKGISHVELVEKLISLAEEKYASAQRLNTAFSTNYLKQF